MHVTRVIAATAPLVAMAAGATCTAWAAPTMNGHYTMLESNYGGSFTEDWYFTPCGDGCANVTGGATGQARWVNGQWTLDSAGPAHCPDRTEVPNATSVHYIWDASTLAGTVQVTYKVAACGVAVGHAYTNNIHLRPAP